MRIFAPAPCAFTTEARAFGAHNAAFAERLVREETRLGRGGWIARAADVGSRTNATLICTDRIRVVAIEAERAVLTEPIAISIDASDARIHASI
jgi:hypothetical protein